MKVSVKAFAPSSFCPKCLVKLPKLLLRSRAEIASNAFLGWKGSAEKVLKAHDIPEEMLLRRCDCGYVELHYPADSGRSEKLVLEVP